MELPKDAILEDHASQEYQERRAYLKSVKMILSNFTENMNFGRDEADPVKLLDFVKNNVLDLMIQADNRLKKNHEPNYMILSSDTESDSGRYNSNRIETFKMIIDEYLGIGEKKSSWHKALIQARVKNYSNIVKITFLSV